MLLHDPQADFLHDRGNAVGQSRMLTMGSDCIRYAMQDDLHTYVTKGIGIQMRLPHLQRRLVCSNRQYWQCKFARSGAAQCKLKRNATAVGS